MKVEKVIEDDVLAQLLILPSNLALHKKIQKISYFYFGFILASAAWDFMFVVLSKQWYLFTSQYVAFASTFFIAFISYLTMYFPDYINKYFNIRREVQPNLWPLRSLGDEAFTMIEKIGKLSKISAMIMLLIVLAAVTFGLPWNGSQYDIVISVKVAFDTLNGWTLNLYLVVFYSVLYHGGLTIFSNVLCLAYLLLHLYCQLHMINLRLKKLTSVSNTDCEAVKNEEYQTFISQEIIACIKLHQKLIDFTDRINDHIYYPVYFYTGSGVVCFLSILLAPGGTSSDLLSELLLAVVAVSCTTSFSFMGQLVENESEKIFFMAYDTPWHLWNTKNRKLLLIFLCKSKDNVSLSASGLITINFRLLIGLYQATYSVLTFLLHVSSLEN